MLTADAIIKAMAGGAVLHKQFIEGEAAYSLSESNGLAHVAIPASEGKLVSESPLVLHRVLSLLAERMTARSHD
jgi:hypothetical protein